MENRGLFAYETAASVGVRGAGAIGAGAFGGFAMLADEADEGLRGAGQAAVAAIDEAQLAPELDTFHVEKLDLARLDLVFGKTLADERNTRIDADKALDHADAGKFHGDAETRTVGAEELVEHLACVPGAGEDERLGGDFLEGDFGAAGERIRSEE